MNILECPALNLTVKELSAKIFDKGVIFIHLEELRNGFKVSEMKETTHEGTSVILKKIEDPADFDVCHTDIMDMIQVYREKYKEEFSL